jgi:hypothetical protein
MPKKALPKAPPKRPYLRQLEIEIDNATVDFENALIDEGIFQRTRDLLEHADADTKFPSAQPIRDGLSTWKACVTRAAVVAYEEAVQAGIEPHQAKTEIRVILKKAPSAEITSQIVEKHAEGVPIDYPDDYYFANMDRQIANAVETKHLSRSSAQISPSLPPNEDQSQANTEIDDEQRARILRKSEVTIAEAAAVLGLTTSRVNQLFDDGELKRSRRGRVDGKSLAAEFGKRRQAYE